MKKRKYTLLIKALILLCLTGCANNSNRTVLSTAPVNAQAHKETEELENNEIIKGVPLTNQQGKMIAKNNYEKYNAQIKELEKLINDYRKANKLSELETDYNLSIIANHRAAENAHMKWMELVTNEDGSVNHLRPDSSKIDTIYQYYKKYGSYGEILGRNQENNEIVLEEWKNSKLHNECILSDKYTSFGVGISQSEEGKLYFAVEFFCDKN